MLNRAQFIKDQKASKAPKKLKKPKDIITDPMGQWAHPGEVTRIPSGDITMQGVPYPVLGIDNQGNSQMMQPGGNYSFPGSSVTEYPQMQEGGDTLWVDSPYDKRYRAYMDSLGAFKSTERFIPHANDMYASVVPTPYRPKDMPKNWVPPWIRDPAWSKALWKGKDPYYYTRYSHTRQNIRPRTSIAYSGIDYFKDDEDYVNWTAAKKAKQKHKVLEAKDKLYKSRPLIKYPLYDEPKIPVGVKGWKQNPDDTWTQLQNGGIPEDWYSRIIQPGVPVWPMSPDAPAPSKYRMPTVQPSVLSAEDQQILNFRSDQANKEQMDYLNSVPKQFGGWLDQYQDGGYKHDWGTAKPVPQAPLPAANTYAYTPIPEADEKLAIINYDKAQYQKRLKKIEDREKERLKKIEDREKIVRAQIRGTHGPGSANPDPLYDEEYLVNNKLDALTRHDNIQKLTDYGMLGVGAATAAALYPPLIPTVGKGINALMVANGVSKIPKTAQTWFDPNATGWDKFGQTADNATDFIGIGILKGLKAAKAYNAARKVKNTANVSPLKSLEEIAKDVDNVRVVPRATATTEDLQKTLDQLKDINKNIEAHMTPEQIQQAAKEAEDAIDLANLKKKFDKYKKEGLSPEQKQMMKDVDDMLAAEKRAAGNAMGTIDDANVGFPNNPYLSLQNPKVDPFDLSWDPDIKRTGWTNISNLAGYDPVHWWKNLLQYGSMPLEGKLPILTKNTSNILGSSRKNVTPYEDFSPLGVDRAYIQPGQGISENMKNLLYEGMKRDIPIPYRGEYNRLHPNKYGGANNWLDTYQRGGSLSPFEQAFATSRGAGEKEFEWDGRRFHTRYKEEMEPEVYQSEIVEPEMIESEAAHPEVTQPGVVRPEAPTSGMRLTNAEVVSIALSGSIPSDLSDIDRNRVASIAASLYKKNPLPVYTQPHGVLDTPKVAPKRPTIVTKPTPKITRPVPVTPEMTDAEVRAITATDPLNQPISGVPKSKPPIAPKVPITVVKPITIGDTKKAVDAAKKNVYRNVLKDFNTFDTVSAAAESTGVKRKVIQAPKNVADTKYNVDVVLADKSIPDDVKKYYIPFKDQPSNGKGYSILSKKNSTLYLFDADNKLVGSQVVLTGSDKGDKFSTTENITPAGEYEIDNPWTDTGSRNAYGTNFLPLKGTYDATTDSQIGIHGTYFNLPERLAAYKTASTADNRISHGCINCDRETFEQVQKILTPGSKIRVTKENDLYEPTWQEQLFSGYQTANKKFGGIPDWLDDYNS